MLKNLKEALNTAGQISVFKDLYIFVVVFFWGGILKKVARSGCFFGKSEKALAAETVKKSKKTSFTSCFFFLRGGVK